MLESLKGKKTYIVAALMMTIGIVSGLSDGSFDWSAITPHIDIILEGAGLAALRGGVSKLAA